MNGQLLKTLAAAWLTMATVGGAACLNRPVLGHLNPDAAADIAMFRTDDVALAGAVAQDPLAALVLCAPHRADRVFVAGREVVRDGRVVALDEGRLAERMNEIEVLSPPLMTQPGYTMISKKHPRHESVIADFNKGLQAIKDDGMYDKILQKHGIGN